MGTVLSTFICSDPDSPGSTLGYQLRFHSPPSLSSLCLSDRVLEVRRASSQTHMQGGWGGARVCETQTTGVKEMVVEPICFEVWQTRGQGRLVICGCLDLKQLSVAQGSPRRCMGLTLRPLWPGEYYTGL